VVYGGIGAVIFLLIRKKAKKRATRKDETKPYFPNAQKNNADQEK